MRSAPAPSVAEALRKALRPRSSFALGDDSDSDREDAPRNLRSRRNTFRRIASEDRGRLAKNTLASMREIFLSSAEPMGVDDDLPPCALRWLLSSYVPMNGGKNLGEEQYRALRTNCEAIGLIASGKAVEALDLLCMRV